MCEAGGSGSEELKKWSPPSPAVLLFVNVRERRTQIEKKPWEQGQQNTCGDSGIFFFLGDNRLSLPQFRYSGNHSKNRSEQISDRKKILLRRDFRKKS